MYKAVGVGLILLIGGCASVGGRGPRVSLPANVPSMAPPPQPPENPSADPMKEKIVEEIRKYHAWLAQSGQLLRPMWPPYDPTGKKFQTRELMEDPENPGNFIPKPEPPPPTQEEIIKRFNELLKDPAFKQALERKREQV